MNSDHLKIRKIRPSDNPTLTSIIQTTMTEFNASGVGFSIHDPEVMNMYQTYHQKQHAYFVICDGATIFGGAGIAPLAGAMPEMAELRKMYFLPAIRGLGLGQKIIERCLAEAIHFGFTHCYLETLKSMKGAEKLYIKNGFRPLDAPLGATGHFSCDSFYLKDLFQIN
jgi:putative acetyltransferase